MRNISCYGKLVALLVLIGLTPKVTFAQNKVPAEVSAMIGLTLDDAQTELESNGYEITYSSIMSKKQYWWSESQKVCIDLSFHKGKDHKIETVTKIANEECEKGLEAARKVWEGYHDGQATISSQAVDKEREKLSEQGYNVSYWIHEASAGKSMEYWFNESTQKCRYIIMSTQGGDLIGTGKSEPSMGKNPAPPKNN